MDRFYNFQKERRELRRRNLQAQTNIAQHFRRHKLNLFPGDARRSRAAVREDYCRLLRRIEALAGQKEVESNLFESDMERLVQRAQLLEKEIGERQDEMARIKLNAARHSVHLTSGRPIFQKARVDAGFFCFNKRKSIYIYC